MPTFRAEYERFWNTSVDDVGLTWVAMLYMMLCLSAMHMPDQMAEAGGFEVKEMPRLSNRWYSASRQALHAGDFDAKPDLIQIQVFLISQIYWYSTKKVEVLNS
jgi:hypothetical protein